MKNSPLKILKIPHIFLAILSLMCHLNVSYKYLIPWKLSCVKHASLDTSDGLCCVFVCRLVLKCQRDLFDLLHVWLKYLLVLFSNNKRKWSQTLSSRHIKFGRKSLLFLSYITCVYQRNTTTEASTTPKNIDSNKNLRINLIYIEIEIRKLKLKTWNWNLKTKLETET